MTSMFMQMFSAKTSLDKLREYGFSLTVFPRIRTESAIMSLYGGIRSVKPDSRVFHAVHITNNNIDPNLPHFVQ